MVIWRSNRKITDKFDDIYSKQQKKYIKVSIFVQLSITII